MFHCRALSLPRSLSHLAQGCATWCCPHRCVQPFCTCAATGIRRSYEEEMSFHGLNEREVDRAQGRQGEAGNGAVAGEGAADAAGDKPAAMPSYSTAMGQLQRAEDDAARQGASLAGVNQQQVPQLSASWAS